MVTIKSVIPGSIAHKKGIIADDILISINGNDIRDVLDYRFYLTSKCVKLLIHRGPELNEVIINKKEYDDIGLEFETYLMDKQHSCKNKCMFCFIDQNPPGMRESLYFKDDDERLSFLHGNYITLTNLTDGDIERIIKMRISPVNVSVHTMNPELRVRMMKNPRAGQVLSYLNRLAEAGISINAQIVLCRGINDEEELSYSMDSLEALYPSLNSVSIVPAGITKHRQGLHELEDYDRSSAANVLEAVEQKGRECLDKYGTCLFFISDEFFLKADRQLPNEDYYEEFAQLDNGVGGCSLLRAQSDDFLLRNISTGTDPRRVSVATGEAAWPLISSIIHKITSRYNHITCGCYKIKNNFYGEKITVAGLITGGDMIAQLSEHKDELGSQLFIPEVMLRQDSDIFLDDMTVRDISNALDIKVTICPTDGEKLIKCILGIVEK